MKLFIKVISIIFNSIYTLAGLLIALFHTWVTAEQFIQRTGIMPSSFDFYLPYAKELFGVKEYFISRPNWETSYDDSFYDVAIYPSIMVIILFLVIATPIFYYLFKEKSRSKLSVKKRIITSMVSAIRTPLTLGIIAGVLYWFSDWIIPIAIFLVVGEFARRHIAKENYNKLAEIAFNMKEQDIKRKALGDAFPETFENIVDSYSCLPDAILKGECSKKIILGTDQGIIVNFEGNGHLLTFAPTGGGKGVSSVMPNALNYSGSMFIIDPKGESTSITYKRRQELNNKVHYLDPFRITRRFLSSKERERFKDKDYYDTYDNNDFPLLEEGELACYNPLDILDENSPSLISDARSIASCLVIRSSSERDPHWNNLSEEIITGLILYLACYAPKKERNLYHVYSYLYADENKFIELLRSMAKAKEANGVIANSANAILRTPEKERGSVLSSARQHLSFLSDPAIQKITSYSTFSFDELKLDTATIFLTLPPEKLDEQKRWLRLMVQVAIKRMQAIKSSPVSGVDTLFILDEMASLGYMKEIESAYSIVRSANIKMWGIFQDINQLQNTYKNWESLIANSGAMQFFKPSDLTTAKYISDMIGDHGYSRDETNISQSEKLNSFINTSKSTSYYKQKYLPPEKLLNVRDNRLFVFLTGEKYLDINLLKYYQAPCFIDKNGNPCFEPNPYLA